MESNYKFHDNIILRTPFLPINKRIEETDFFEFSKEPFFMEAIYLASPVLYNQLEKWHTGLLSDTKEIQKLSQSLLKYYKRMQSRCTPYGLFAGCSVAGWSTETQVVLNNAIHRHTRLDMNYLCSLVQQFNQIPEIKAAVKFYPNNSIYVIGSSVRYVEYKYKNNSRFHEISSVTHSQYLQQVLDSAKNGATIKELANCINGTEISFNEAKEFIEELIENQLLISEFEPSITGPEFMYQIISIIEKIFPKENKLVNTLLGIEQEICEIDKRVGNDINCYKAIHSNLKTLGASIREGELFQVDLFKIPTESSINSNIQQKLFSSLEFLNKLTSKKENYNLKRFKENFYTQYENMEVPLLEALDTETGVGYLGKDTNGINLFLDDLFIQSNSNNRYTIEWSITDSILHEKLIEAFKENHYTVVFTNDDLKGINNSTSEMPDTLPVMFKIVDNDKIFLQNFGGSGAANLLARFGHGNEKIKEILGQITAHEKELNPDIILAEIIHLPESRIGNILLRPKLREFEIPYLAKSSVSIENQITLNDLYISVRKNKLILRSKRLNKEILPKLSTAHNYSFNGLPVYHFLADLQNQNFEKSSISFNWGTLSQQYKFLPRAEYEGVILYRSTWNLLQNDFKALLNTKEEDYLKKVTDWKGKWRIPRYVVLSDADNELLIDFDNLQSVKLLVGMIKNRTSITLQEFLFNPEDCIIKDVDGNNFTNEFISILLKRKELNIKKSTLASFKTLNYQVERNFPIGSEWLYYKIYCGINTADKVLKEIVAPVTENLFEEDLISKFFFIRYADPEVHLRIRFKIKNLVHLGKIIQHFNSQLQESLNSGIISKIQIDTYKRELERYGSNSMEIAESLFYIDSLAIIQVLDTIGDDDNMRWKIALKWIDDFLDNFNSNLHQKFDLIQNFKDSFIKEHGEGKGLKVQLDGKFRLTRKEIESAFSESHFEILRQVISFKNQRISELTTKIIELDLKGELEVELNSLVGSFLHMSINRFFKSRQRTYEMVLYDLLFKYYKSLIAKNQKQNIKTKDHSLISNHVFSNISSD